MCMKKLLSSLISIATLLVLCPIGGGAVSLQASAGTVGGLKVTFRATTGGKVTKAVYVDPVSFEQVEFKSGACLPSPYPNTPLMLQILAEAEEGYELKDITVNGKSIDKYLINIQGNWSMVNVFTDSEIILHFESKDAPPEDLCSVTLDPDIKNGTLQAKTFPESKPYTFGDKIAKGSQLTLVAKANDGYKLHHWIIDGQEKGIDKWPTMTVITVSKDMVVSAVFAKEGSTPNEQVTITYEASEGGSIFVVNNKTGEEVKSGSKVNKGTSLNFQANNLEGYEFEKWEVNGKPSDDNRDNLNILRIQEDQTVKAFFKKLPTKYDIKIVVGDGGTAKAQYTNAEGKVIEFGAGETQSVLEGTEVTVTATPSELHTTSFDFNGTAIPATKDNPNVCKYVIKEKGQINVTFTNETGKVAVIYTAGEHGTIAATLEDGTAVKSGSTVKEGTKIVFTATPAESYQVESWEVNGKVDDEIPQPETITVTADKDLNVKVSFKIKPIFFSYNDEPEHGKLVAKRADGTILDPLVGVVEVGEKITLVATPDSGYKLDMWKIGGQEIPAEVDPATKKVINEKVVEIKTRDDIFAYVVFTEDTGIASIDRASIRVSISDGRLYVIGLNEPSDVTLYAEDGQALFTRHIAESTDVSQLAEGVYIVRVQDQIFKVIK